MKGRILFFFFSISVLTTRAQDTRPSYEETVAWLVSKVNSYTDYEKDGYCVQSRFLDHYKAFATTSGLKAGCKDFNNFSRRYEVSVAWRDITRVEKDVNLPGFILYTRSKGVEEVVYKYDFEEKREMLEEKTSKSRFGLYLYLNNQEPDIHNRFLRALNTLVYYNTKDLPKEAF